MLEVLGQDFIRTARAKGLSELSIVTRHAMQGGLLPVVSFMGPAIAGLLGGSFVVETIFQIPGLGRFYVEAAFNRDYTMILGTTIFFSAMIVFFKLLSDLQPGAGNEIHITDAIRRLIKKNEKFVAHNFMGSYLDCGSMHGYIKSSMEISKI